MTIALTGLSGPLFKNNHLKNSGECRRSNFQCVKNFQFKIYFNSVWILLDILMQLLICREHGIPVETVDWLFESIGEDQAHAQPIFLCPWRIFSKPFYGIFLLKQILNLIIITNKKADNEYLGCLSLSCGCY